MVYLTIPGDDDAELSFKVAEGARITDVKTVLDYVNDGIYGTPQNPLVFDLDGTTGMGGILESADDQPAYDLQGREVPANSAKGIIIINNEKMFTR